jgi:flagellar basal-body rod protein FlgG
MSGLCKFFSQGSFKHQHSLTSPSRARASSAEPERRGRVTRSSNFKLDNNGRIVNANGYPCSRSSPCRRNPTSITEKGHTPPGQEATKAAADITIYNFVNPAGLNAQGRNLYTETDGSGAATSGIPGDTNFGTLAQGFLEGSNVEMVDEMVGLIIGQRAYEVNSKALTTSDTMLQTAINVKR